MSTSSLGSSTSALPSRPPAQRTAAATPGATHEYIRGSSMLLGGRVVSIALNLLVQVMTVRYLSKSDYGAFAYGIGVASMGATAALLGLEKSTSRFVSVFREHGEMRKAFGTIALAFGMVLGTGLSLVLLVYGFRGMLSGSVVTDPQSLSLLLILIVLAPINALDSLMQVLMAIFVGPRAIFFRRHVLGPGLRLAAVLFVILTAGDAHLLAWGYVIGGLLGVSTYATLLVQAWKKQGLLAYARIRELVVPTREVLSYSFPLLSSELVMILRGSLVIVLLEYMQTTSAVAEYRAVSPIAKLNLFVLQSFSLLFIPLASRLFARNDKSGINDLYWKTAVWITVLSFPIFAATFSLAEPITVLLFGPKYAASASVLAVLALGHYVHAVLGFNTHTLRVCGRVRYLVTSDIAAAVLSLGLHLMLIPRYGALGAAIGTTCTFVLHNVFNHVGLSLGDTGVRLLEWRYLGVYLLVATVTGGLLLFQLMVSPPLYLSLAMVALASLFVIRFTRRLIRIDEIFPKLLRVPLLRRLLT